MNRTHDASARHSYDRRDFLKTVAKGLVAISMAAAGSVAFFIAAPYVPELSNGADNFYGSTVADVPRVSFKNHYGMRVAANVFTPQTLDRKASASSTSSTTAPAPDAAACGEWFTGPVRIDLLHTTTEPSRVSCASVAVEPVHVTNHKESSW